MTVMESLSTETTIFKGNFLPMSLKSSCSPCRKFSFAKIAAIALSEIPYSRARRLACRENLISMDSLRDILGGLVSDCDLPRLFLHPLHADVRLHFSRVFAERADRVQHRFHHEDVILLLEAGVACRQFLPNCRLGSSVSRAVSPC